MFEIDSQCKTSLGSPKKTMLAVPTLPIKQWSHSFPVQGVTHDTRLQSSYGHGEGNITFYAH